MARAWPVSGLHRRSRFRDAAGRIILTRWREMMSYRDGTLLGDQIEQLHAMRVSSRRLRSAMDAFSSAFPADSFKRHLGTVKQITDTLGAARDLDVAIAGLTEIRETFEPAERPGIDALIAEARERRSAEDARIHALFERIAHEDVDRKFERWVARHTGVRPDELDASPSGD